MKNRKKFWAGNVVLFAAVSLLASVGFTGTSSAVARFNSVKWACGKAVSKAGNYRLMADIGPCNMDGIIFKSSGTVLDLNGFEIKGMPIIPDGPDADTIPDGGFGEGVGIRIAGNKFVTITNMKHATNPSVISDFDTGLVIQGSMTQPTNNNTVTNIVFNGNIGRQVFNGGAVCEDPETPCEQSEYNDGLSLATANFNTIGPNNVFSNNGSGGVRIDNSSNNTITGNLLEANLGNGVRFLAENHNNLVTGNISRGNFGSGVNFSFENPDNIVENNTLELNRGFGVAVSYNSERTIIRNNPGIQNNWAGGITLGSGANTVSGNTVTGNGKGSNGLGRGNGIFVGSGTDNFPRTGTTVSGNTVTGSGGNGIRINCMSDQDPVTFQIYGCMNYNTNNTVSGNTATGNSVNAPNGTAVKSGFQTIGWHDLHDSSNSQATMSPSFPGPMVDCSTNAWSGNTFGTAYPAVSPTCIG